MREEVQLSLMDMVEMVDRLDQLLDQHGIRRNYWKRGRVHMPPYTPHRDTVDVRVGSYL